MSRFVLAVSSCARDKLDRIICSSNAGISFGRLRIGLYGLYMQLARITSRCCGGGGDGFAFFGCALGSEHCGWEESGRTPRRRQGTI